MVGYSEQHIYHRLCTKYPLQQIAYSPGNADLRVLIRNEMRKKFDEQRRIIQEDFEDMIVCAEMPAVFAHEIP